MATVAAGVILASLIGAARAEGTPPATTTSYYGVAAGGELVTYTVDTTLLTYSYTITESEHGLTGHTKSGTLTRNADGSYSLSGIADARIALAPDGLLFAALHEDFGKGDETVPIMGVSNPITTFSAAAGLYNAIVRACTSWGCVGGYGTFRLDGFGNWESCNLGNLGTGSCPRATSSGTFNALGAGKFQILGDGKEDLGTALFFVSNGQNVAIMNRKSGEDDRRGALGTLVGSIQAAIDFTQTDGRWLAGNTDGHWGTFTASGANVALNSYDGQPVTDLVKLSMNTPWAGLFTTPWGGFGLLAGTGVYSLVLDNGFGEFGIKLQ